MTRLVKAEELRGPCLVLVNIADDARTRMLCKGVEALQCVFRRYVGVACFPGKRRSYTPLFNLRPPIFKPGSVLIPAERPPGARQVFQHFGRVAAESDVSVTALGDR